MHAAAPWLVTWDDHEFENNCAGAISERRGVAPEDFLKQRARSYQAYYEHMPLRQAALPKGPDMLLYRKVQFGKLAEFFVLDTRQYRSDQPNGDGNKPPSDASNDPKQSLLGEHHAYGEESLRFYTRYKSVMQRWPSGAGRGPEFTMPVN